MFLIMLLILCIYKRVTDSSKYNMAAENSVAYKTA